MTAYHHAPNNPAERNVRKAHLNNPSLGAGTVKMQHTSCTEDRIQHALERCLDGLARSNTPQLIWNAGQCMNRWSLEELVKRDPENFLILLQQILRKTRKVLEQQQYELVAPLALMFESTLLQTPYCPSGGQLLAEALEVFHGFLTWPEPYCTVCQNLLATLHREIRAPGISYHRLMREEQGLATGSHRSKTLTVLLMNPAEVPAKVLSVAEQLSALQSSPRDIAIALVKHAYQAALGTKYPLQHISHTLQSRSMEQLEKAVSTVTELMEKAAATVEQGKARAHLVNGLEALREELGIAASNGRKSDGMLQTLGLTTAKCYMFHWDRDNFDVLNNLLDAEYEEATLQSSDDLGEEEEPDEDVEDVDEDLDAVEDFLTNGFIDHRASTLSTVSSFSTASKDSMFSTLSVASSECSPASGPSSSSQASGTDSDFCEEVEEDGPQDASPVAVAPSRPRPKAGARLTKRISRLFKPPNSLSRTKSLGSPEAKRLAPVARSQRSYSLPQQAQSGSYASLVPGPLTQLRHVCYRRRPILSSDEEGEAAGGGGGGTLLRVVVFGPDSAAGRVARAYSSLRRRESVCPRLSRTFRLRFLFVPVRGGAAEGLPAQVTQLSISPGKGAVCHMDLSAGGTEDSTHDIARLLGMLDPWYERNTLSLLHLPVDVVCQQTSKAESDQQNGCGEEHLPILADMVLYYCRHAVRPALIQLYHAELTLAGGEKRTEVFIHSLELGHTAGTRAIRAMGAASKRFGIDGDREAVPLKLAVDYNRVVLSGRSHWTKSEKVCTSINLTKACKSLEELDSKMEFLQLTMTEVLKRQNSKSKKGYNQQITTTKVKVDKVDVSGVGSTTFAVCLDQDKKKILQSVARCEVSVCYKPDSSAEWARSRGSWSQVKPLHPTFCSLLCLPIATFSGPQP